MDHIGTGVLQAHNAITISQVADLCKKIVLGKVEIRHGDDAFVVTRDDGGEGILSIRGVLSNEVISMSIEVLRAPGDMKLPLHFIFIELGKLGDMVKVIPRPDHSIASSFWLGLGVKAAPISFIRAGILSDELDRIDKLARSLQAYLPSHMTDADMEKKYAEFKGAMTPVYPWEVEDAGDAELLGSWAEQVYEVLLGSASVAITSPQVSSLHLAGGGLARVFQKSGALLGLVVAPAVSSKQLIEMASGAPGYVMIQANNLSLGANIYELGKEIRSLLTALSQMDKPLLFAGSFSQLQSLFHGGQGGEADPLAPVIFRVPDLSLKTIAGFSVSMAGRATNGIGREAEETIALALSHTLRDLSPTDRQRVLPATARRIVKRWSSGQMMGMSDITSYAMTICGFSETFSGLSITPRTVRPVEVQERFIRVLTDPELLPFLKSRILGQDQALEQLVLRLSTECLTRPLHVPLSYCAQGTPGTGKSESTALLAERLGVPLVHIDAASIPDYYSGAAQLLGSGRGIVGSYQSGRLEQAAKHHSGVVIEVSDLDHANPSARSYLADLFLQVLEVGEATSAVGATFSCASAIFGFTMNLPNGMDEAVRRGIGFSNMSTRSEVTGKVVSEIKEMLSSAFLSRVGMPILFDPLSGDVLGRIIELAIEKAIPTAAERLGRSIRGVAVMPGTGMKLMDSLDASVISFGARLLIQQGRYRAGGALKALFQAGTPIDGKTLIVSFTPGGLLITTEGGME